MTKRITQTIQREIVDINTGEIVKVDTQKTFTEKINPEQFYHTYLDYVAPLYDLRSEVAHRILVWMCVHAEYNTGKVLLPTAVRDEMQAELQICNNSLTNNLKRLKDLKIITGDRGVFYINPAIFWKGDATSRTQAIDGKSIEVSFRII